MEDGFWHNGTFYPGVDEEDGYFYNGTYYPEMDGEFDITGLITFGTNLIIFGPKYLIFMYWYFNQCMLFVPLSS